MASSCPFRRTTSHVSNGAVKRTLTPRQSSIQITMTEELEEEDKNTLNLKHLNAAILILTAPPVSKNFDVKTLLYFYIYNDFLN